MVRRREERNEGRGEGGGRREGGMVGKWKGKQKPQALTDQVEHSSRVAGEPGHLSERGVAP